VVERDAVPEEGYAFDRATSVRPEPTGRRTPAGAVFEADIDGGWAIGTKPNGGYLLATLARGAAAATGEVEGLEHPHPLSASAHFLSAPDAGPAEVHTEVLRRGKRLSQVRSRLVQDGTARVEAVFTLGRLDPDAAPWWDDVPVPADATPEARCTRLSGAGSPSGLEVPLMGQIDLRLDPAVPGFAAGAPTGRGEVRGFVRFADGRPPDPVSLLLAVDVLPPATFDLGSTGWVPTFELTAYVRRVPAPGPLLVRHRVRLVESDMVDEACDVWDARGRLVAQATQLAGVRVAGTQPATRR
jgi:hypothetical protein